MLQKIKEDKKVVLMIILPMNIFIWVFVFYMALFT